MADDIMLVGTRGLEMKPSDCRRIDISLQMVGKKVYRQFLLTNIFGMSMSIEWIPRLRGHVDLVKRLVEEVPLALDRPGLTIGQAERLQAVIEKGARDFDDVVRLMSGPDEREYSDAAKSLTNIWSHLAGIAADKVQYLNDRATAKTDSRRDEHGETE